MLAAHWHRARKYGTAHCKGRVNQSAHERNWAGMFRALQHSPASTYLGPPSSPPDAHRSPRFRASNSGRDSSAEMSAGQPCAAATTASTERWVSAGHCGGTLHGFVRVRFLSACKARNASSDLRTLGSRSSGVRDEAWDNEFHSDGASGGLWWAREACLARQGIRQPLLKHRVSGSALSGLELGAATVPARLAGEAN